MPHLRLFSSGFSIAVTIRREPEPRAIRCAREDLMGQFQSAALQARSRLSIMQLLARSIKRQERLAWIPCYKNRRYRCHQSRPLPLREKEWFSIDMESRSMDPVRPVILECELECDLRPVEPLHTHSDEIDQEIVECREVLGLFLLQERDRLVSRLFGEHRSRERAEISISRSPRCFIMVRRMEKFCQNRTSWTLEWIRTSLGGASLFSSIFPFLLSLVNLRVRDLLHQRLFLPMFVYFVE